MDGGLRQTGAFLTLAGEDLDAVKLEALGFSGGDSAGARSTARPASLRPHRRSEFQIIQESPQRIPREVIFRQTVGIAGADGPLYGHGQLRHPFADRLLRFREVAGVKMPFHWVATWTDGQSTVELSEVQPKSRLKRPSSRDQPQRRRLNPRSSTRPCPLLVFEPSTAGGTP